MYHTIEIVDFTKSIRLENNTIDNRDGRLQISLKSVNYWVGYYNVTKKQKILRRIMNRDGNTTENSQFIKPGLYNIKQITDIIHSDRPWVEFIFDEKSGTITLLNKKVVRNHIHFPSELANLLGLPNGFLSWTDMTETSICNL